MKIVIYGGREIEYTGRKSNNTATPLVEIKYKKPNNAGEYLSPFWVSTFNLIEVEVNGEE